MLVNCGYFFVMASSPQLHIGTRGSALARWQAEWVAARLAELGVGVTLVPITTSGDVQQRGPVESIGTRGVFTKEIQRELLERRVDVAVHSLKDLPTDEVPGLCLAAVPERAPAWDVLVGRKYRSLADLPSGALVGTGSLRRQSQLRFVRPDLKTAEIRGNVDTRLRKLDEGAYDAIVLAEAGLRRLGLESHISEVLPASISLPAVGQGALGIEARVDDEQIRQVLAALDHAPTHAAVVAERAMLAALEGGCLAPIAAWGRVEGGQLRLSGRVLDRDGTRRLDATLSGELDVAADLGRRVAEALIGQGALELIHSARQI
jgi:hydroxymethylbilane synthase